MTDSLDSILRITEEQAEKHKDGFSFWSCIRCGCELFSLDSDRGVWSAVCSKCSNEYDLRGDGSIQLTRAPQDEEDGGSITPTRVCLDDLHPRERGDILHEGES